MINIKPARRQAYRYGRQIALLKQLGDNVTQLRDAAITFISQFDAYEGGDVLRETISQSFTAGLTGSPEFDVPANFVIPTSTDPMYTTT